MPCQGTECDKGQTPPAQQAQEWAQLCGTGQGSPGSLCHTGHKSPWHWGQQSCDSHSCWLPALLPRQDFKYVLNYSWQEHEVLATRSLPGCTVTSPPMSAPGGPPLLGNKSGAALGG